jgi:hypothetical protein
VLPVCGGIRPLGNVFPHFGEVKELVEPDVGGEVKTTVEKREEPEHAPEADEFRQSEHPAKRRNGQGDQQKPQRPIAGSAGGELNGVRREVIVQAAPYPIVRICLLSVLLICLALS